MTNRDIIGQNIAELRKACGMTQAELADKLSVSHQAVSQWERSETLPDILTLPQIAKILFTSVSAILGIEEDNKEYSAQHINEMDKQREQAEGAFRENVLDIDNHTAVSNPRKEDTSGCQVNVNGYSLPTSENTIDLDSDSDYEVVVIQDGKIIAKFAGDPNKHPVTLVGTCRDLRSEMSVEVQGDVQGNAHCGVDMTIHGNVGANATAGFKMQCGDVGENAAAGFELHCNQIGSKVSGGINIKQNENAPAAPLTNDSVSTENLSFDGRSITIAGDYNGDLSTAATITIQGSVEGDVQCNTLTVEGDIEGDANSNGSMTVGGDINGDVDADGSVTVNGDINGDVNAGGNIAADGDINGDVDAGNQVTAEGDINGDVRTTGDVRIEGDAYGDVCGKNVTIEGDYNG